MSKEKRVKERAAWRELEIIIRNYRALGEMDCQTNSENFSSFHL